MKKYLSLLAISAFVLVAQPTSAINVDTLTNFNVTLSKSTSSYQTTGFEQIGIVASAADQDGLKLLTVQRYTVTGALTTLGTTSCERQKGCAVITSLTPTDRDANSTISLLIKATDINGNERTSRGSITVGEIRNIRDGLDYLSISSTNTQTITIPRDGSSVSVYFSTTVYDNTGIKSVTLNRTNPIVGGFPYNVSSPSNFNTARGENCRASSPCTQRAPITFTTADVGRTISVFASASPLNDDFGLSNTLSFRVVQEATTDRTAPAGSITATPNSFTVDSGASPIVELRANVTDNTEIKSVRFYRTNPQTGSEESVSLLLSVGSVGLTCNTAKTSCTASDVTHAFGSIRFTETSPAYYNVPYYAIIKDAAGNETRTASVNVRLNNRTTTPSTTGVPTITFSTSKTSMTASEFATLSATATSNGGVYAVEIRALPSWTETVTKRRCTITGAPRSGSCSLEIGPYTGRTSGTIKVWAIAWDNTSGLGGNSGEKTITITR